MLNYDSKHKNLRNKTLDWFSLDSEESYKENLKNRYAELAQHNWIGSQFTYRFNSYGFRCNNFDAAPTVMYLGCSFTMGVGVPEEQTWPKIVSDHLGLGCANLGIAGGSPDTTFRMCHGYIDIVKPKIVILMLPDQSRYELVSFGRLDNVIASKFPSQLIESYYKLWIADDNNSFFNSEKNLLAINMMCSQRGIKCLAYNSNELSQIDNSLGRDLAHPGIINHQKFADKLLNEL